MRIASGCSTCWMHPVRRSRSFRAANIKLAFRPKGNIREGELRVNAPRLPAQAIPGIYMLFVVDKAGVPSVGRQLRLNEEDNEDNEDNEHRRGRLE